MGQVWLVKPDGGRWERLLIVDCAGDQETIDWMLADNVLIEVGHEMAHRWQTVGQGIKVEVLKCP